MMLITLAIYYAGWFFTIALAAAGRPWWASLASFGAACALLIIHYFSNPKNYYREIFLAFYAILIGFFTESLFLNFSITAFKPEGLVSFLPPLWIVLLYPLFSMTISGAMHWMISYRSVQAFIGVLAPICYIAGEKVGACLLPRGYLAAYLVIGAAWPVVIMTMTALLKKIEALVDASFEKSALNTPLYMLYDGKCPICSKEVRFLKDRDSSLRYIDIADGKFKSFSSIGYEDAMKAMIAVEEGGKIHTGVDAFHEIYLRRRLFFLAIILKLPVFEPLFKLGYSVFAKYRLALTGRGHA